MMITITCEEMGAPCKGSVSGETMDDVLKEVQRHAMEGHGYSFAEANSPEKLDLWRGAIRQTARPSEARTIELNM